MLDERNLLLSVCKSLGIRIRWSRMECNKQLLGKKEQGNTSQVLGLVLSLSDEGKVRAYIPITRWKDKLSFDKLKDKMGAEQRKDGWSTGSLCLLCLLPLALLFL